MKIRFIHSKLLIVIIMFIFILSSLILLASCSNNNAKKNKIQIWYYTEDEFTFPKFNISRIVESAKFFCEKNNIPLEIYNYNSDTLSREDYIFKRNLAASFDNTIILDDVKYIRDLAEHHADYTKLSNYKYLIEGFKDNFCIPFYTYNSAICIENEAIKYYGINTSESVITYYDYLKIKQTMRKNGADFELNNSEYAELIDYYLYKNNLLYSNETNKILNDNNNLKKALKKTIIDVCEDIILYYDKSVKIKNVMPDSIEFGQIYDKNSNLKLKESSSDSILYLNNPKSYIVGNEYLSDKTFYISPTFRYYAPCFFMHNKITNVQIYDLANHILSEYNLGLNDTNFEKTPIFINDIVKENQKINDNFEFIGEYKGDSRIRDNINDFYNIIFKNNEKSQEIANYYYLDNKNNFELNSFIFRTVIDIARKISDEDLSLERFDSNNEDINIFIDDKIHEFVVNFSISSN